MLSKPPTSHPNIPTGRRGVALALLSRTKNPSQLARAIYLSPETVAHTTITGHDAEAIGETLGIKPVDPSYFFTEDRWKKHRLGLGLPVTPYPPGQTPTEEEHGEPLDQMPTGTVGAVALDLRGCIASVTSTGGRGNRIVGRIGDTAQMGAGFWAEEWEEKRFFKRVLNKLQGRRQTRAIGMSCTGNGDVTLLPLLTVPRSSLSDPLR
jgi:isoaspartyl peptidase/L-asparaginase-like protein (Ntn-hydrolase superfamily)